MSDSKTLEGHCLCGEVQVTATVSSNSVGACHCSMCRQWTSSPMQTLDCGTDVSISGETNVGVFSSSDWAERGFCKQCGSTLFYKVKANGQYFMAAGLFGDLDGFEFDHEVFIDEKPAFYSFAGERKLLTSQEVFDFFTSNS